MFNIFVYSRDIEYLRKLVMGIFGSLEGILACLLPGIWDIWYPPIQASFTNRLIIISVDAKGKDSMILLRSKRPLTSIPATCCFKV